MSQAVDETPQYTWTTNVEYDSWNSILTLIDACGLTVEEKLLLNCLSIFSCSPIPFSMVTELASIIAKSAQKPHLAGTLHCNLIKYKLICIYPHPVVLTFHNPPSFLLSGTWFQFHVCATVPFSVHLEEFGKY